jgi:hypothetical protein
MVLSEVDKHAIEVLFKEKGWGASRIFAEFPNRGWKLSGIQYHIQKLKETGTSDRRPGSGRPVTASTPENIEFVMKRSMSAKEEPGTSLSERQMAAELGIARSSVQVIKKKLDIRTFTRIVTPRMNASARARRSERADFLRCSLTEHDVPNLVFYDEKDLTLERPINRQTNKVCGQGVLKRDVSPERLFHQTSRFSKKIMVCGAASYRGLSKLVIVDPSKTKVDSEAYQSVLKKILPSVRKLYPDEDWIFVQDSAPSHRSNSTQEFLTKETPSFIPADGWPPHSPDLNPLDYHVWGELRERVYQDRHEPFASLEELSAATVAAWKEIPLEHVKKSIDRFRPRLDLVAEAEGGPIQHLAR